jgi:hypothetical protein
MICCPPPQSNKTIALRQQFDTSSTNLTRSDYKGKTIILLSMEICNTAQYEFVPFLLVALILIPDLLNFFAVPVNDIGADMGGTANGTNASLPTQILTRLRLQQRRQIWAT